MNRKIILSSDSTCDLSADIKEKYSVNFFPYHILLDEQDYIDNVTITPTELFDVYYKKKLLPKTAAINSAEYGEYFKKWVDEGYDVIHFSLGSALSKSYHNCTIAAEEIGHVYPIDSCNLSTGIGLLVMEAGEMIKAGLCAEEIKDKINAMISTSHASFVLDTLEFMRAGGRCSAVAAFGANLLQLKPCIEVDNANHGSMKVTKKYRGSLASVLVSYVKDRLAAYDNIRTDKIFITHSGIDQQYIDIVRDTINSVMKFDNIYVTTASCTISCHCGPNTLGILFLTEN